MKFISMWGCAWEWGWEWEWEQEWECSRNNINEVHKSVEPNVDVPTYWEICNTMGWYWIGVVMWEWSTIHHDCYHCINHAESQKSGPSDMEWGMLMKYTRVWGGIKELNSMGWDQIEAVIWDWMLKGYRTIWDPRKVGWCVMYWNVFEQAWNSVGGPKMHWVGLEAFTLVIGWCENNVKELTSSKAGVVYWDSTGHPLEWQQSGGPKSPQWHFQTTYDHM